MVVFTLWRNFAPLYGSINFMSELEIHFMSELLYGEMDFRKISEINNFMSELTLCRN